MMAEARVASETIIIQCFSCKQYPGLKEWRGYFKKDEQGNWRHIDCPRPLRAGDRP